MYNHPYDSYDPQCTNTKPPWTSEQSQTSRLHSSRRRTTTLPAVTWTMSLWPSKVNASLKVSWRIFWYQQGIGQVNQQSLCYNISYTYTILDTEEYKHSIVPIDQKNSISAVSGTRAKLKRPEVYNKGRIRWFSWPHQYINDSAKFSLQVDPSMIAKGESKGSTSEA